MPASNQPGARQILRLFKERRWPRPSCLFHVGLGAARELGAFRKVWRPGAVEYVACEPCRHWQRLWEKEPSPERRYPGRLLPIAVGERDRRATFYERRKGKAASGLFDLGDGFHEAYDVQCATLDTILGSYGPFGDAVLLWLDCEGSELAALRGGSEFLKDVRWLNVELTGEETTARYGWPSRGEAVDFIRGLGFEPAHWHSETTDKIDCFLARKGT